MDTKVKNDILNKMRAELFRLRKEREKIVLEKGLVAQGDKDLRENSAYETLELKEHALTSKIHDIIREIYDLSKKYK